MVDVRRKQPDRFGGKACGGGSDGCCRQRCVGRSSREWDPPPGRRFFRLDPAKSHPGDGCALLHERLLSRSGNCRAGQISRPDQPGSRRNRAGNRRATRARHGGVGARKGSWAIDEPGFFANNGESGSVCHPQAGGGIARDRAQCKWAPRASPVGGRGDRKGRAHCVCYHRVGCC